MSTGKTIIAVIIAALALSFSATATSHHHVRCTEDMACWNCHTMGNKICGTP